MSRASVVAAVRRPQSAAIAGLVFAVILSLVIVLIRSAAPASVAESQRWVDEATHQQSVGTALNLIPFGGIAFLWFIAVARSLLGSREDRFFETVFLGSGLLLVATLFVGGAALAAAIRLNDAGALPAGGASIAWVFSSTLLGSFGTRMAAVFAVALSTAGLRVASMPRWLGLLGYATGLVLLLTPPLPLQVQLVFPAWVAVVSIRLLVSGSRSLAATDEGTAAPTMP